MCFIFLSFIGETLDATLLCVIVVAVKRQICIHGVNSKGNIRLFLLIDVRLKRQTDDLAYEAFQIYCAGLWCYFNLLRKTFNQSKTVLFVLPVTLSYIVYW